MSKNINVNPDFYKIGGREHAEGHGEAVPYDREKQALNSHDNQPASRKAKAISSARAHAKKK
jgi:hypothetical protein